MGARRTLTTFPLMGSAATIVVPEGVGEGEGVGEDVLVPVRAMLRRYEALLTVNGPPGRLAGSQVEAVNRAAGRGGVVLDEEVYALVEAAVLASRRHRDAFNVLLGPVVKAWGIGFAGARVPEPAEIDRLLALTDPDRVELDRVGRTVALAAEGMRLDLGAIAKGWAADRAAAALRARGVAAALVDLGGNVVALGGAEDGDWRVGVQSPTGARGELCARIGLRDRAAATSGGYERVLEVGGRRYHHMIDPLTGYPFATDLAAVTVTAPTGFEADLWATLAQRGGLSGGHGRVEDAPGIEALFVTDAGRLVATSGLAGAVGAAD